jgi:hypothetical protein
MPILIQLEILNTGSHFSEDKYNLMILYSVMLLVFIAMAFLNKKKYEEDR